MSASTDLTPYFGALFQAMRAKQPHAPTIEMFTAKLRSLLEVWDATLATRKYCAGNELTAADLSLWGSELAARPAIQRAMKF